LRRAVRVSRFANGEEVFPRFKQLLTDEQIARVPSLVNRHGFWMA